MSVASAIQPWRLSHRFSRHALPLADRHYNRRTPGSPQFVAPGRCVVLLAHDSGALWVSSWPFAEYANHAWAGAWICSLFRNESAALSSDLIRSAVAATRAVWGEPPPLGFVTFIDAKKTLPKEVPGWCYRRAGWKRARCQAHWPGREDGCAACAGLTKKYGLVALQLRPSRMRAADPPAGFQASFAGMTHRGVVR